MRFSPAQIIALEVVLRPLIPYIIPALLLPWPLIKLRRTLSSVEGIKLKSQIQSVVIIGWAYIILNLPYSLIFIVHYVYMWKGVSIFINY